MYPHIFINLIFLLISLNASSSLTANYNFQDFDTWQYQLTEKQLCKKLEKYLEHSKQLQNHYSLTSDKFYLYASQVDKEANIPEYSLFLNSDPTKGTASSLSSLKSLKGIKIAIDAGHFGGKYARLEDRYIDITIPQDDQGAITCQFQEGDLTLATSKLLQSHLEELGATVACTRNQYGKGAISISFKEWLQEYVQKNHLGQFCGPLDLGKLFLTQYNRQDLAKRVELINEFQPDITIIIHYNFHPLVPTIWGSDALTIPNYNMTFTPGSFLYGELDSIEQRYHFLRLLLTDDLESSSNLSHHIANALEEQLGVPLVDDKIDLSYLKNSCIKIDRGVYARNLFLTRQIVGPLCYVEALCQNNKGECLKLEQKDVSVEGQEMPHRVEQVAKACLIGIENYFITK
ncbi:MAG: hypothetical protein K0S74_1774 [Chlamydiales bacterium]|jgi:N-acetylmuramoyl-L-alanine amidase|nr:hypothetical protein [Chlamydiales bacterium]